MFGFFKKRITLEDQINTLNELGIRLETTISIDYLFEYFDREEYEQDPYYTLLTVMGGEFCNEKDELVIISNDVWHFDMECVEDEDIYAELSNKEYNWELEYNYDWFDIGFVEKFSDLCSELQLEERYIFLNLEQDCIISFCTLDQYKKLNKLMKYKFEFMA
ncbi:hypothetical protein [Paenibacillus zanthoxyli]|uniref:hypothetical protein n=1 Tax=Paenibacillus zanthoxyli TaxID=369399 RepID=UPI000471A8A7|nr:hypothetical protein [Paenibacillus zanthoxyli]